MTLIGSAIGLSNSVVDTANKKIAEIERNTEPCHCIYRGDMVDVIEVETDERFGYVDEGSSNEDSSQNEDPLNEESYKK